MSLLAGTAWFALHVRQNMEEQVSQCLRYKGYEEFLPLCVAQGRRRRQIRNRPLFPGYVFCRLNPDANGLVVTTPGVMKIVGFGGKPVPVEDNEINALKLLVSSRLPSEPYPFLSVGEMVEVEEGPLAGVTGILLSIRGRHRLLLSVRLMMRSVSVEMDRNAVRPLLQKKPPTSVSSSGYEFCQAC